MKVWKLPSSFTIAEAIVFFDTRQVEAQGLPTVQSYFLSTNISL